MSRKLIGAEVGGPWAVVLYGRWTLERGEGGSVAKTGVSSNQVKTLPCNVAVCDAR